MPTFWKSWGTRDQWELEQDCRSLPIPMQLFSTPDQLWSLNQFPIIGIFPRWRKRCEIFGWRSTDFMSWVETFGQVRVNRNITRGRGIWLRFAISWWLPRSSYYATGERRKMNVVLCLNDRFLPWICPVCIPVFNLKILVTAFIDDQWNSK